MLGETMTLPSSDGEQIRELNRLLELGSPALVGPSNERIELPEGVYQMPKDVVRNMSVGRAVALIPQQQQMTTQSAANFLGFSRPHLVKLLDSGTIPFEKWANTAVFT